MKKYAYYPGCSLTASAREFDESTRILFAALGAELAELPDWNCCGASAGHSMDDTIALSLPARILQIAEKSGLTDLMAPCAACYNRLKVTNHGLMHNAALRAKASGLIDAEVKGSTRVMNVLEALTELIPMIKANLKKSFAKKTACYYGCLLVRPNGILEFDRPEDPVIMDEIMLSIGAEPVDWAFKTECCGAALSISRPGTVGRLSGAIIHDAEKRGAEAIIVACPLCHANLDMRRNEINRAIRRKSNIPIIYITQAVGLALGCSEEEMGLGRHFVPVRLSPLSDTAAEDKAMEDA